MQTKIINVLLFRVLAYGVVEQYMNMTNIGVLVKLDA